MQKPDSSDKRSSSRLTLKAFLFVCLFLPSTIVTAQSPAVRSNDKTTTENASRLFARDNLIAWCIVPFDSKKRGPEDRAAMLEKLGFKHFAYDWRAEHIPTFDAEIEALKRHGIALDAFWVARASSTANRGSSSTCSNATRSRPSSGSCSTWAPIKVHGAEQERRVEAAAAKLRPLAQEAGQDRLLAGALQPRRLVRRAGKPDRDHRAAQGPGVTNVGMVYNLHHGHDHLDRFPALLAKMMPYLMALNLNGMDPGGDKHGRKILPLGQGARDLELLRTIVASGYRGPIGILGPHHGRRRGAAQGQPRRAGLAGAAARRAVRAGPRPSRARPSRRHPRPSRKPRPSRPLAGAPMRVGGTVRPRAGRRSRSTTLASTEIRSAGPRSLLRAKFACLSCHRVGDQRGHDRSRPVDRRGLSQARGNRRVDPLAAPPGQGGLRGVHRRHQPTARSGRATSWPRRRRAGAPRPRLGDAISASPRPTSRRSARTAP